MARNQISQLGRLSCFANSGHGLFGDVFLDLGITLKLVGNGPCQCLKLVSIARHLSQVFRGGLKIAAILDEIGDADAVPAFDQHLYGTIRQFQQLQHIGQHASLIDPVLCGIVLTRINLAG